MKRFDLISIILLFLCSCESDLLEKTIFIPDENDGNLPAYTEWGYNSFGAKYERSYFIATNKIVPCKITYQNGILNFSLIGRTGLGYYSNHYDNGEMTLTFSFPCDSMKEYKDLMVLHKKEYNLADESFELKITQNNETEILTIISGHLAFKRAQLLRVDDQENRVILSGTFDARFLRNLIPEVMSDGRFDLGINYLYNLSEY